MSETETVTVPDQLKKEYEEHIDHLKKTGATVVAQKLEELDIPDLTEEDTYQELRNIASDKVTLTHLENLRSIALSELGLSETAGFDIEKYKDLKKTEIAQEMADYVTYTKNIRPVHVGTKQESTKLYEFDQKTKLWREYSQNRIRTMCKKLAGDHFTKHLRTQFTENLLAHPSVVRYEEMGTPPDKLVINNGKKLDLSDLSDLENLTVEDAHKEDLALHSVNVDYNPDAECPNFKKFVNKLLDGEENQIKTLQEFMGWLLKFPDRSHKKALLILGVSNSGKSQLLEVVEHLFEKDVGDSVTGVSVPQIGFRRRFHIAKLSGSIVNLDKDLSSQLIDDPANVKLAVSQEKMDAEPKGEDSIRIHPQAKFMIAANVAPQIQQETDDAFYGRFLTLKARNEVPKQERVTDLGKKLYEKEGDGIFMWMLEGLKRLEENGKFTMEPAPYETKLSWLEFGDAVHRFIWERCELTNDMNDAIPKDDLYEYYKTWSEDKLLEKTSKRKFKAKVSNMFAITDGRARIKDVEENSLVTAQDERIFRGVKLKDERKELGSVDYDLVDES